MEFIARVRVVVDVPFTFEIDGAPERPFRRDFSLDTDYETALDLYHAELEKLTVQRAEAGFHAETEIATLVKSKVPGEVVEIAVDEVREVE